MAKLTGSFKGLKVDTKKLRREIEKTLGEVGKEVQADYQKIVRTWTNKPTITIQTGPTFVRIFPSGEKAKIFGYVDLGTRPHIIAPKKKLLAFKPIYKAKTSPGTLTSKSGGSSGATVFTQKPIHHPGTKPRDYTKALRAKWGREFPKRINDALIRVFR